MEDEPDMDIEENTLMYPRIESIYSDVNIKTEPIDIDEDEYDTIEIAQSTSDYYIPFPNKIILGSKPPTIVSSEPTAGPSIESEPWEEQNFFECAECYLLFPTQNELDSHRMASHSFLVARPLSKAIKTERRISVSSTSSRSFLEDSNTPEETTRRQKAVKSTSKGALNKTFPMLHDALMNVNNNPYGPINPVPVGQKKDAPEKADGLLCKHCDVRFPDEIALIKHTYELLPETKFDDSSRGKNFKTSTDISQPDDNETLLQCLYCTCFLIYPGFMKKHLQKNHKVTEFAVKRVKFTGKCAICTKTIVSYKQYNKHVLKFHRKIFFSRTLYRFEGAAVKLKCLLCNQIFDSRYTAYKHKALKHPEHSQRQTFLKVYDKPIKAMAANPVPLKLKYQTLENLPGNETYIPKQNLFKCNKCQIHFVSCFAGFAHSTRCSLAKGDWKCNKCRRTFTKAEKFLHMQQHKFSEKFKVHIACDKILSKVLCRCPKCELLFDEILFRMHVSADCIHNNGVDCKTCNLRIHSDSYAKHRRLHNKYNFTNDDFIIIDYVNTSFQNAPIEEEKKEEYKQTLIYCSICTCHFYKIKSNKMFHLEGQCKSLNRRCCTMCGLTFSQKPFITHMNYDHGKRKLKLDDYNFLRIQDYTVTNPVMPEFFPCQKCEVRFISPMVKTNHSCSKQVFVKCAKCSQKYDSVTYDIHLTFHNYGRSKTENKGPAVLLKFYSCVACNYGFNSYDGVVEHCQKHFINSEDIATKLCKICNLKYGDDHKNSHPNQAKFKIFRFDYERLLTDNWLDGFGSLPKTEVEDILSKSVYGAMRNIRLELLVEGPADRPLYKCVQCELNFEQDHVLNHSMESCSSTPRYDCGSCAASFKTRVAKNNHMNIHVVYGDDIIFREIIFNNGNDKELNEALRTGRQKESLKFRKCQQCKLLIKKSDYQAHISAHGVKGEVKQFMFRRNKRLISYKVYIPGNATKKLYTVYKCKLCNACIMKKSNIVRHKCGPPDRYEQCSKCSLYFLACNIKRHIAQHAIIPKFVPKNICILEFQILDNKKNLVKNKKRRRYSSDDDASTESRVNLTVSKTYDTRKVIGRPYSDNLSEDSQDNIMDDSSVETPKTCNAYAKKYIKKSFIKKVESDNESEESDSKIKYTPEKNRELLDITLDLERWKIDMKNKLYQCERCYLCFAYKDILINHLSECDDNSLTETPLVCNQCNIVFHPSLISFHEKLHDLVQQNPNENYLYLTNISTNGVNTNNGKRWLYRCKICDVQYLSIKALASHFNTNHKLQGYLNCEICGLKFTQKSRTRHTRIQHNESGWSLEDLHIEITEKKIVNIGEIQLVDFVKTHSRNRKSNVDAEEISRDSKELSNDIIERDDSMLIKKLDSVHTEQFSEDSVCSLAINPIEIDDNNISDMSNAENEKTDHNLYKCDECFKHYLSKLTLIRHISSASHKAKPLECDLCGLLFGKRTLKVHKSIQHKKLKLGREDFIINEQKLNVNDSTEKEGVSNSLILNVNHNQIEESDKALDANLSQNEKQNDSLAEKIKEMKHKMKSVVSGSIDNHVYKCVECSVYYTNRHTLLLHIVIRKHKQFEFLRCDICGLLFGRGSLQKHKSIQHQKLNLTRKDFIITDVFGSQLVDDENSIKNPSSIDTDDLPLTDLEVKETLKGNLVKEKNIKIFRLYQCKDCKICVKKNERSLHVCCSDIQKRQCIKCCLLFRNTDVIQHNRLHRKYSDLSRKNFMLTRYGRRTFKNHKIYRCVTCSTHFVSLNTLEWHMNTMNHQTKRDYCKHCGLFFGRYSLSRHIYIHHNKLNLTVQQFNITYVSDMDKNSPNMNINEMANNVNNSINTTVSEPEASSNVKTIKKLFKCVECDVYFLTRASYYYHIYKHRKLDATEYIDCNICDFQFLNESLGVHMKSHKDKSFCLDKLLIEEYQPNSTDSPKIEFYYAKDSLNSKLVSTTTPFDNDDEGLLSPTDEQLSIIDSTSDEIPKVKVRETISAETNSYPHNSNSNREENALNPIVELPNLDVCVKFSE